MHKESTVELPEEFLNGPWLTAQEIMEWLKVTKDCLKTWRARGVLAYSSIGGITLYNKPWILQQLKNGWTRKVRKK